MKKLLFAAAALLLGYGAMAQGTDIRLFGGLNVVQLTSDGGANLINGVLHNETVTGRPGYQFGGAVTFGKQFFVQPGVSFMTISTEAVNKNTVTGDELTDKATISVLSIPLHIGFRLIDPEVQNTFNVRIFGGFSGNHVTGVNHKEKSSPDFSIEKEDFSNLIVNADFGLGIDVLFLFVDASYSMGISPIYAGNGDAKANGFILNAGLRIGL